MPFLPTSTRWETTALCATSTGVQIRPSRDNRALRTAMESGLPLAYFVGVGKGVYFPHYPVWLKEEDVVAHEFVVALDEDRTRSTCRSSACSSVPT